MQKLNFAVKLVINVAVKHIKNLEKGMVVQNIVGAGGQFRVKRKFGSSQPVV